MKIVISGIKLSPEKVDEIVRGENGVVVCHRGDKIDLMIADGDILRAILEILREKFELDVFKEDRNGNAI